MDKRVLVMWINNLLKEKKIVKFYQSTYWQKLRKEVLREQKHKCQECLKIGRVTTANTVHHIQFVDKHPELALSKFYTYKGKQYRNLIAVCSECHNKLHPEKHRRNKSKVKERFINEERW